jgi:hypothetical protein
MFQIRLEHPSLDQHEQNISEQGSSAMPNVSEKKSKAKGNMTKSEHGAIYITGNRSRKNNI